MKRLLVILATILLLSFILTACSSSETPNTPNSPDNPSVTDQQQSLATNVTLNSFIDAYNSALRSSVSVQTNTNVSDSEYIGCAKTLISKALKNPSSAQYNESRVYEKDNYGRAIVYLDISAQNGFGGWVRSQFYVCIHTVDSDGTFTYNSTMPYIDDESFSLYESFKSINDFNVDPVTKELKGLLVAQDDYSVDSTIDLSPSQTLDCYVCTKDTFVQYIYINPQTKNIVSVQTSITNSSNRLNCEKIISATASALTSCEFSNAKNNVENVLNFSNLTPKSAEPYYTNNCVYECSYEDNNITLAVTITSSDSYDKGLYWTPINQKSYYEKLADQYIEKSDFDNAIAYYEKALIQGDKLYSAYYGKAEQSLENGELDTAGAYFGLAGNYKDSAVRVLEVYYSAGKKHEGNNDFISAINSYSMAGDYSDAKAKYKECNFKQGEKYLTDKQYREASDCFEKASDYVGAIEKFKESCYLYAEQQLLIGDLNTASSYFSKAADYEDASTRMLQYYYEHGKDSLTSKKYLEAIDFFKNCIGYLDSNEKYKEANYLYGEELLKSNSVESAKKYFYDATGYKDADTRIQRYYYEGGTVLLNNGDYLNAAEKFVLANTYSDAKSMEKECYYQYAKKQIQLNYITIATEYFTKCRGYKDTDDILLGYYYSEASKSVTVLINKFSADTFTWEVDEAYTDAKEKLILCEGYQDSNELLGMINKLYYAWGEMDDASNYEASLYDMKVIYSGNIVTITKENFMSGTSCSLSMTYNIQTNTFSADITHLFNLSAREYDVRNVISAMIILFTDIEDTTDLDTAISNKNNWTINGEKESFNMSYGGYSISIKTQPESYGYIDCEITVSK